MIWSKMVAKVVNENRTEDGPGAGQPLGVCLVCSGCTGGGERNLCRVSVSGTLRSGREPGFKLGVTLATTNPREQCREQLCAGGLAPCGANGSGELPSSVRVACQRSKAPHAARSGLRAACRPGLLHVPAGALP